MAISDKLSQLSTNITNAYTEISNKGGTIPTNKNTNNLDTAIATIPTGITPIGTINITTNGETDVTNYATANVNVPTGGGGRNEPPVRDFTFVDYDGTVLYSYTKDELLEMTELPALPTREGMTYQGWNWSLYDLKQQPDGMVVGALCRTSDNSHRIYISLDNSDIMQFYFAFTQSSANAFEIDWGDGSAKTKSSSTSVSVSHKYTELGDYVITIKPIISGAKLTLQGSSTTGSKIGTYAASSSYSQNFGYYRKVKKIEFGSNVQLNQSAFYNHCGLETINTPADMTYDANTSAICRACRELKCFIFNNNTTVTQIYSYSFAECSSIAFISLSKGIITIQTYAFYLDYSLRAVMLPKTVTSIGTYTFYTDYSLERTNIPNGITTLGNYTFSDCRCLNKLKLPTSLTSIGTNNFIRNYVMEEVYIAPQVSTLGANTFAYCYGAKIFDFRDHTTIPTLSQTSAFTGILAWSKIVVPDNLYDDWIAATNWSSSSIKSKIVKASDYTG